MHYTQSEIVAMYHDSSIFPPVNPTLREEKTSSQMLLAVPEQQEISINDESPIDRYGPQLRRSIGLANNATRRSSCYSRNTDGYSLTEHDGAYQYIDIHDDNATSTDVNQSARVQWAPPIPDTPRYGTQHGNESRLMIQGLSDPYKSTHTPVESVYDNSVSIPVPALSVPRLNISHYEPTLPPIAANPDIQRTRGATPPIQQMEWKSESILQPVAAVAAASPGTHRLREGTTPPVQQTEWQFEAHQWPGATTTAFSRSPTPPIRPPRESTVSPSFRKQTSLLSPFKTPPTFMASPSQLANFSQSGLSRFSVDTKIGNSDSSVDTKMHYLSSKSSYTSKNELMLIIVSVALTTLSTALDRIITTNAIPRITDQFRTIEDMQWYSTAYLMTSCSAHLFYGKLYRFYSTKWIFIAALGIFETGCLISGIAPVSAVFILGRVLAGLGAAGLLSGGVLIVGHSVQTSQKSTYLAILAGMSSIVFVAGPVIGGVLTQYASWRWCFYINLPFGVVSFTLLLFSYNPPLKKTNQMKFRDIVSFLDLEGTFLFLPSIVCLLLTFQYGGVKYAWTSAMIIVLIALFLVTIIGFGLIQNYKNDLASVPPRILLNRNVYGGMLAVFCLSASFSVVVFYLPLWFQTIMNTSPLLSGVMLLPLVLSIAISSVLSSTLIDIIGYYTPFILFAAIMMSIGGGLLTTLTYNNSSNSNSSSSSTLACIGYQIVFGLGAGSGMQQGMLAVRTSFQKSRDIVTGVTLMTFAQMLGGAVAMGVAQSVFQNRLVSGIQTAAANITDADVHLVLRTGATDLRSVVSAGEGLATVLRLYGNAIEGAFLVAMGMAAVSILGGLLMEWHSVRGKGAVNFMYSFR